MRFLPKKEERYFAALRLYLQKAVLRHGVTDSAIARLKKIYLSEALLLEGETQATDLIRYADILLGSASLILLSRGISVRMTFSGNGVMRINRRRFAAFLLQLAARTRNGGRIHVTVKNGTVAVRVFRLVPNRAVEELRKALGAVGLKTADGLSYLFYWQAIPTNQPPAAEQNEWLYLTDGFSAVNVYLENIPGGRKEE